MENLVNCIELDDGNTYAIIDEIEVENEYYVYLVNIKNEEDFCIRKKTSIQNQEAFIQINESEFEKALLSLTKKHQNMLENE